MENGFEAVIQECKFDFVDGNAITLSGRNEGVKIKNNHFSNIGGNAMVLLGKTDEMGGNGADAVTKKEYPDKTLIDSNLAYDVGYYEKQSSFYFQAKTARTTIKNNIFFNGPRAGICFNDGFGGGDLVTQKYTENQKRKKNGKLLQKLMNFD